MKINNLKHIFYIVGNYGDISKKLMILFFFKHVICDKIFLLPKKNSQNGKKSWPKKINVEMSLIEVWY